MEIIFILLKDLKQSLELNYYDYSYQLLDTCKSGRRDSLDGCFAGWMKAGDDLLLDGGTSRTVARLPICKNSLRLGDILGGSCVSFDIASTYW